MLMHIFDPTHLLPENKKYDFFISYSHSDKGLALDIYHIAMANGLHAWLDDRDIGYGDRIKESAALGIQNSKAFLVINSVNAACSKPVEEEISEALELLSIRKADHRSYPIIAFLADGHPVIDQLKDFKYVNNRNDHPLAAILKLIQSLSGLDMFDTYLRGAYTSVLHVQTFEGQNQYLGLFDAYSYAVLIQTTSFLTNMAIGDFPEETLPAIQQLMSTSKVMNVIPRFNSWLALGNGVFESIHPVTMRKAPDLIVEDLPNEMEIIVEVNNEVVTRIQFVYKKSREPVLGPFPFQIHLDAEL